MAKYKLYIMQIPPAYATLSIHFREVTKFARQSKGNTPPSVNSINHQHRNISPAPHTQPRADPNGASESHISVPCRAVPQTTTNSKEIRGKYPLFV